MASAKGFEVTFNKPNEGPTEPAKTFLMFEKARAHVAAEIRRIGDDDDETLHRRRAEIAASYVEKQEKPFCIPAVGYYWSVVAL